jgi:hypothetical protein
MYSNSFGQMSKILKDIGKLVGFSRQMGTQRGIQDSREK